VQLTSDHAIIQACQFVWADDSACHALGYHQPDRTDRQACISFHTASAIRDMSKPVNRLQGRKNCKTTFEKYLPVLHCLCTAVSGLMRWFETSTGVHQGFVIAAGTNAVHKSYLGLAVDET